MPVSKALQQQVVRILSRKFSSAQSGLIQLVRKGNTPNQIINAVSGKNAPLNDDMRVKLLRALNKGLKPKPGDKTRQATAKAVNTLAGRVQDEGLRRRANTLAQSFSRKFSAQQVEPPKGRPATAVKRAQPPAAPATSQGLAAPDSQGFARLVGEMRGAKDARRNVAARLRNAFRSGKAVTGKAAALQAKKAAAAASKGRGIPSLIAAGGGGFLLSKFIGGGGSGGDPTKAAARQQILQTLMGRNTRADRQPLIDAQAELARVRTMALLAKIVNQKVATQSAIPFA